MVSRNTLTKLEAAIDEIERRLRQPVYCWQSLDVSDDDALAWVKRQKIGGEVTIIRWSRGESDDGSGRPT